MFSHSCSLSDFDDLWWYIDFYNNWVITIIILKNESVKNGIDTKPKDQGWMGY